MRCIEQHVCHGGHQHTYEHESEVLACSMKFSIYLPPHSTGQRLPVLYWLSGLTCNEQNFVTKANAQQFASQYGIILVAPDTSPRGDNVADAQDYDLGQGAGFYVNATQEPWQSHFKMYDYIVHELPKLIDQNFSTNGKKSIFGHSMGGYGAIMIALRNLDAYQSVSAFAPITLAEQVPWGQKAFTQYLGTDQSQWKTYQITHLIQQATQHLPLLIDQGLADNFLQDQLKPQQFKQFCDEHDYPITLNMHEGYDHSYYFITSFIQQHFEYHMQYLK